VGGVEFFDSITIAIGLLTRPAAVAAAILLFVAAMAVHLPNGFFWTKGPMNIRCCGQFCAPPSPSVAAARCRLTGSWARSFCAPL
jgi:uncharacterized membrane protein YphA (DoxX/SURF4 family)